MHAFSHIFIAAAVTTANVQLLFQITYSIFEKDRLIGQKTCYKTAITIKISMVIAVLSFLKEDKGWTKNVFRMHVND